MDSLLIHERSGKIYTNSPRYIVWGRASLNRSSAKAILTGGSNLRKAIHLGPIQDALGDVDVHNLSAGGMNITQMRQIVDLAMEVIPKDAYTGTTFVFALSFALFVDNDHHWRVYEKLPGTRVEMEMKRFGLYRSSGDGHEALFPPNLIPEISLGLWPLFALSNARRELVRFWRDVRRGTGGEQTKRDMSRAADRQAALNLWRSYMGTPDEKLRDEQFVELVEMSNALIRQGVRVVLVDMPVPKWLADRSNHDADYQQRKGRYFPQIIDHDLASYIDLRDIDRIEDYVDSGHLNERAGLKFSSRLANQLAKYLNRPPQSTINKLH